MANDQLLVTFRLPRSYVGGVKRNNGRIIRFKHGRIKRGRRHRPMTRIERIRFLNRLDGRKIRG